MSGRGKGMSEYVKRLIIDENSKGMSPIKNNQYSQLPSPYQLHKTLSRTLYRSRKLQQKKNTLRKTTKLHYDLLQV